MSKQADSARKGFFDLGFEHGAEADEDPSELEFRSRVPEYQLGYILGRNFNQAVKQASWRAGAVMAEELGRRYGVDLEALLGAMALSEEMQQIVRRAYAGGAQDGH